MKNIDWNKTLNDIEKLYDDASTLERSLADDYDSDINDWCKMLRFMDRLHGFKKEVFAYLDFNSLIASMENEKDRFLVQKTAQFHTDTFKGTIDVFIDISRNWKMRDYRCQNYQRRMETFFLELQQIVSAIHQQL